MNKKDEMISFIETQINVKIISSRETTKRNIINFDDNLQYNEMCKLKSLSALSKKFEIVQNGHKTLAIKII